MMYFFYASQPYALDLLGREDLIWVAGALTALFGLTSVIGNTVIGGLMKTRWGTRPTSVMAFCVAVNAGLVATVGLVGLFTPEGGSIVSFVIMVAAFSAFGTIFGVLGPVRQAYINRHIPSEQRATVLSLDSFFNEVGGMVGQPGFGWIAKIASIPVGYVVGSLFIGAAYPLYKRSGRAAEAAAAVSPETEPTA
jgi:sugar phosphate permease